MNFLIAEEKWGKQLFSDWNFILSACTVFRFGFMLYPFDSPEMNSKKCSLQTPLVSEGGQNRWLSCSTTAPAPNTQFCKSFFNPFRVTYFWYFGYFSSIFLLQQSEVWGYSLKWNELWNDRQLEKRTGLRTIQNFSFFRVSNVHRFDSKQRNL